MSDNETTNTDSFECPICYKEYAIRSSWTRHSRKCLEQILSGSRQKSCRQCADSKLRCDRVRPTCTRCSTRGDECEYIPSQEPRAIQLPTPNSTEYLKSSSAVLGHNSTDSSGALQNDPAILRQQPNLAGFGSSDAVHGSLAHDASSEKAPAPCEQQPTAARCLSFISRIFRTYPRMMAGREQLPPFIHSSQTMQANITAPLSNCFALTRMWESSVQAAGCGDIVQSSIRREMKKHFSEYHNYDHPTLVAAFQSLLIYAIILLFPDPRKPPSGMFDLQTLVALRDFGIYINQSGLVLPEEKAHTRPSWNDWVLVSCKRRSVMVLNLLVWINAMHNGFKNFPCAESDLIPAPAGKLLWNMENGENWEVAYDKWLGRWAGLGIVTHGDLERPRGLNPDLRPEMWLEEADEFGIMLISLSKTAFTAEGSGYRSTPDECS